jgi:SAM-dependent methyltransferase
MMFGFRDTFEYLECPQCGCLQLSKPLNNPDKYYAEGYANHCEICDAHPFPRWSLRKRFGRKLQTSLRCAKRGAKTWETLRGTPMLGIPDWMAFLPRRLSLRTSILDVGCGNGADLLALRDMGFSNLIGVDPFITRSVEYAGGVRLLKEDLFDFNGAYSLIMLHHSFEHMADPVRVARKLCELLRRDGQLLIRIPIADSFSARQYRTNWVQLDPPRHLVIQTKASMEVLAGRAGLLLEKVVFDSTSFQFWGSEQYRRNLPLEDSRSVLHAPPNGPFTPAEMHEWEQRAVYLNQMEQGDQAVFYLRRNTV